MSEWIIRYLPAEISGTVIVLLVNIFSRYIFGNAVVAAFLSTWAENVGFYGMMVFRDWRLHSETSHLGHRMYKVWKNLMIEFGPSEILDSFVIRPVCLFWCPLLIGNVPAGLIIGKIVADIIFYVPTIIAYELRKS